VYFLWAAIFVALGTVLGVVAFVVPGAAPALGVVGALAVGAVPFLVLGLRGRSSAPDEAREESDDDDDDAGPSVSVGVNR